MGEPFWRALLAIEEDGALSIKSPCANACLLWQCKGVEELELIDIESGWIFQAPEGAILVIGADDFPQGAWFGLYQSREWEGGGLPSIGGFCPLAIAKEIVERQCKAWGSLKEQEARKREALRIHAMTESLIKEEEQS